MRFSAILLQRYVALLLLLCINYYYYYFFHYGAKYAIFPLIEGDKCHQLTTSEDLLKFAQVRSIVKV